MPIALKQQTLDRLPDEVAIPGYDRRRVSRGILHVGVGNFHRAHMGVYLDELFALGEGLDWGIVGAGVRPADAAMRAKLMAQDWLTTVVELAPSGPSARVTGAMVDFLGVDAGTMVAGMADPRIRIVSLSVTEGGYFIDAGSDRFDADHAAIRADALTPDTPRTLFGIMIKALRQRRAAGIDPFTVLSCDNLPGNGRIAQQAITGLARLFDPGLADWIAAEVAFPNAMVDRITPATTQREKTLVAARFGIDDAAPVVCEPFRQWVIEDRFPLGRPPLDKVGVDFVRDVSRHELMKLRILNAGHASIAYAASLLGYHYVHHALADSVIRDWLQALVQREVIPTLAVIAGVSYPDYLDTVVGRFANPEIGDTIPRLAADGSDRQPKFVLPTVRDALGADGPVSGLALEVALWCRYCLGEDENGRVIDIRDPLAARLRMRATEARHRPQAFLEDAVVFGDLDHERRFATAFGYWVERLHANGVRAALRAYSSRSGAGIRLR